MKRLWPYLVFATSLLLFVILFYLIRHFMTNLDEYDNIAAPYLMYFGKKFYTDIFNMHFPFPFYFAFFFSPLWVSESFSRAISIFRLSILFFYVLCYMLTFLSFKKSNIKIIFSFWILLQSIFLSLYHGNLYLSETFTAITISSIFWLTVPVILKIEKFTQYHFCLLILFSTFAFWTQPLLIILFLIPFFVLKSSQYFRYIIIAFFVNLVPIVYFALNGQLLPFINQAILFNFQTYSHFFPEQIASSSMVSQNISQFFKNEIYLFSHFLSPITIFQFIAHLSLIVLSLMIFRQKKLKNFLILIIIILSTRLREIKIIPGSIFNFGIYPFICISSTSLFFLSLYTKNIKTKIFIFTLISVLFITASLDFYPIFKQSLDKNYNYDAFWSYRQRIGEDINRNTKDGDTILIYPYQSDLYFFAKRHPFDNFLYWYPWVNSVPGYRQLRESSLTKSPPALIYISDLAYKNDPNFYGKLFPGLLDNYTQVKKDNQNTNLWVRKIP